MANATVPGTISGLTALLYVNLSCLFEPSLDVVSLNV